MKTKDRKEKKHRLLFTSLKELEKETLQYSAHLSHKERLQVLTNLLRTYKPEMFYKNGKLKPLKRKIYFPPKSE